MGYRLFLYKTNAVGMFNAINRNLKQKDKTEWENLSIEEILCSFPTEKIKAQIERFAVSDNRKTLCHVEIKSGPKGKQKYISVSASWNSVKDVLIVLHAIATKSELILYDAERDKTFNPTDLFDKHLVALKKRGQAISDAIAQNFPGVYRVRKLSGSASEKVYRMDYVVTLKEMQNLSLEERFEAFRDFLRDKCIDSEEMYRDAECILVMGEEYRISFTLEAYGAEADKICYIENGKPMVKHFRRKSCEQVFRWADKYSVENIHYAMHYDDMKRRYPNPADRFAASAAIRMREYHEMVYAKYGGSSFGGAVSFRAFDPFEAQELPLRELDSGSVLHIDEMNIGIIQKIFEEFYPYFSTRFYDHNYIPIQMWEDIVSRMKEIRELMMHDTFSEKLKPYMESHYFCTIADTEEKRELLYANTTQFVFENRHDAVRILDVFINWSEEQFELYCEEMMLHFEGP